MKVVLCGPPRSGKSCLRHGLKEAIGRLSGRESYCYPLTCAPDGEGAFFHEAALLSPEHAKRLKDEYRGQFTPEFVQTRAAWVRDINEPLVLVDIGGIASPENEQICQHATHAVLLGRSEADYPEWEDFCARLGLRILARLRSDYHGTADQHELTPQGVLVGSIHRLERGELNSERPTIVRLAQLLLDQVAREQALRQKDE